MSAINLSIVRSGNNVVISWAGGTGPFQLQKTNALSNTPIWTNLGNPTLARSATIPIVETQAFFRIQGEVPLMTETQDASNVHLAWQAPDVS